MTGGRATLYQAEDLEGHRWVFIQPRLTRGRVISG